MILSLNSIIVERERNTILKGVSLNVPEGSFFVLMGPTGCGKSTTLRTAGLLERPYRGDVLFRGERVPLRGKKRLRTRRLMATVFQNPVMFRGSVRKNLEWGLGIRRLSKAETSSRIDEAVAMTGLEELLERDASTLSGGETRRAALARALAIRPELMILDEPVTSLHSSFRKDFLKRLKSLHSTTGTTYIMATHNFADALAAGTCGAVMNEGEVVQQGSLSDILFNPSSRFMADFTGTGNILPAELSGRSARAGNLTITHTSPGEGKGFIAVPPEVIAISLEQGRGSERNRFPGKVISLESRGLNWTAKVQSGAIVFDVALTTGALDELDIHSGSEVFISFKASSVKVF